MPCRLMSCSLKIEDGSFLGTGAAGAVADSLHRVVVNSATVLVIEKNVGVEEKTDEAAGCANNQNALGWVAAAKDHQEAHKLMHEVCTEAI